MFQWQRETPVQWQTLLDRVCPAGERLSKFRLVWEPGDLQIPVQRWVIWQMRPPAYHPAHALGAA